MACAEAYLRTKWHFDPSGRLATIDMDGKVEAVPLSGEMVSHLIQRGLAKAYLRNKWHLDASSRFATIDIGRKVRAALPPF